MRIAQVCGNAAAVCASVCGWARARARVSMSVAVWGTLAQHAYAVPLARECGVTRKALATRDSAGLSQLHLPTVACVHHHLTVPAHKTISPQALNWMGRVGTSTQGTEEAFASKRRTRCQKCPTVRRNGTLQRKLLLHTATSLPRCLPRCPPPPQSIATRRSRRRCPCIPAPEPACMHQRGPQTHRERQRQRQRRCMLTGAGTINALLRGWNPSIT